MNKDLETINTLPDDLRADLSDRVKANWEDIFEGLLSLAKGAWYEEKKEGKSGIEITRIYQRLPDKEVAQYLANQIIGKPKENLTLGGKVNFMMDEDSEVILDDGIVAPLIEKRSNWLFLRGWV